MRGITRVEKKEAFDMFGSGKKPAEVARILSAKYDRDFPLSTITTWYSDFKPKRELSDVEKRGVLRDLAKDINESEARIMTSVGDVLSPDMTDKEYFAVQQSVLHELQNFVLVVIPYLLANSK